MDQTSPFKPIFDKNSKIFIFNQLPSLASNKFGFYKISLQNRLWQVLAQILNKLLPETTNKKIKIYTYRKITIHNTTISCKIKGSSKSNTSKTVPAILAPIFKETKIKQVYVNGDKAYEICKKYLKDEILKATSKEPVKLQSTSPVNAKFNLEKLLNYWQIVTNTI